MDQSNLPKFLYRLFEWFCKPELFEELQGDLEEAFDENMELHGLAKAKSIYRKEVLKMLRPSVMKHINFISPNITRLPKNYLKTSLRAIKLNPFYLSSNIIGMALALSVTTIGYFNYHYNKTFNQHFDQAENLYKVHGVRAGESTIGSTPAPLTDMLRTLDITAMRCHVKSVSIRLHKKLFQEKLAFVDSGFISNFSVKNIEGRSIGNLEKNEILISEATALKLFNEIYPVGELVEIIFPNQKNVSFIVKDVLEDKPYNISFHHTMIIPFENYHSSYDLPTNDWSQWVDGTFIKANREELARVTNLIGDYIKIQNEANPELKISEFRLDNILEWPKFENDLYAGHFRGHLHSASVIGIASSALAILLLACFNFINTSIALSGKRLKEIAVRKILGGNRRSTISQIMIENVLLISIAVVLSFLISYFLIPAYNALFNMELIQMDLIPYSTIATFSLILIATVTILSGAYPALHISKFSPLNIFRNKVVLSGKNKLMTVLLTFQFTVSFYNIFGLFLMSDNAQYQKTLDRGYQVDQVINVPLNRPEQFEEFRNQLIQSPVVSEVAGTQNLVGFSNAERTMKYQGLEYPVSALSVGLDYLQSLEIRLSQGSFFVNDQEEQQEVIVNDMLQRELDADILNKTIGLNGKMYNVIGVVDDFNLRPIVRDNVIKPTVIKVVNPESYKYAAVKVNGIPDEVNETIESIWYEIFPQELYTGFLQEDVLRNVNNINFVMIRINQFLGIIAILISVLGLYTLIALTVQRRSKEFGIRKVLGASQGVIIHLLSKKLYWMLAISGVLGLTGAAYILNMVFDIIYAYHITASLEHFLKAILTMLGIIIVAIGYKAYQTGRLNPTEQLRTE